MKRYFMILLMILQLIPIANSNIAFAESRKKLYINNFNPGKDVSKEFAAAVRDQITLSIFEHYGQHYQIVTDDDIKVMYEKAELMMAAGSDSESTAAQVANALNADEIIYGTVSKDGNNLRFTIQNLKYDSGTKSACKKSFVNHSFTESKMEWYCREAGKKLVDPDYEIDPKKAVSRITAKFEVEDVKFQAFQGVNISKIEFESNDEISTRIVEDLKTVVEKGDKFYKDQKYDEALEEYRKTVTVIGRKLRKETQAKIKPFTEGVLERIAAVHGKNTEYKIDKTDKWLKSQDPLTVEVLKQGKKEYEDILNPLQGLPSHEKIKMDTIFKAIEERIAAIYISWVSVIEKKGDALFRDYQFKKAVQHYGGVVNVIDKSEVKNQSMSDARNRMEEKKKITLETGTSWLENKVLSYCNASEYLNMRKRKEKAREYLERAKALIQDNKEFANERMVSAYKDTARIVLR